MVDYSQREGESTRAGRENMSFHERKGIHWLIRFGDEHLFPPAGEISASLGQQALVSAGFAHRAFLLPFLCLLGTLFQFWESGWRCQSRCLSFWLQEEGFLVRLELEPFGIFSFCWGYRGSPSSGYCSVVLGMLFHYLYHMEQSLSEAEKNDATQ